MEKILNEISLTPIRPEDAGRVRDMAERIWWQVYPAILDGAQIRHMLDWMYDVSRLEEEMRSGMADYRWWMPADGGERAEVGYLAIGPGTESGEIHLHKFYLLPDCHGQGYGSAALRALAAETADAGADRITLRVNRRNEPAIRCYLRNGFRIERDVVNAIGGGFVMDDHWMRRDLEPRRETPSVQ